MSVKFCMGKKKKKKQKNLFFVKHLLTKILQLSWHTEAFPSEGTLTCLKAFFFEFCVARVVQTEP